MNTLNEHCKILLLFLLLLCSVTTKAETVEVDGLYYELDPTGAKTNATFVAPSNGSSYAGEIEIPNKITFNGIEFKVIYILTSAFENAEITSLVLPYKYTLTDQLVKEPLLGSTSFGSDNSLTESEIEDLRKSFHKAFDTCSKLKNIYQWVDAKATNVVGDGHIYYNALHKPYSSNWIDSKETQWHVYTPKATDPEVKFKMQMQTQARESDFIFSTGNFTDYPNVVSIDFPSNLRYDEKYFFTTDADMNCPKLVKYSSNGKEFPDGVLYYGLSPKLFAIPPGITGEISIEKISMISYKCLPYSNISKLIIETISEIYTPRPELFENFDGDICINQCCNQTTAESLFGNFTKVLPGHTLYCDPYNAEVAKKYWTGDIKPNDFYIVSVDAGLSSIGIQFGGSEEKLARVKDIRQYLYSNPSSYYGDSEKISDSKWVIRNLYTPDNELKIHIFGVGDYAHPLLKEFDEQRKSFINNINGSVSEIKQISAKVTVNVPNSGLYDNDVVAATLNIYGSNFLIDYQDEYSYSGILKGLKPNQNFSWVVYAYYSKYLWENNGVEDVLTKQIEDYYVLATTDNYITKELKVTEFDCKTTQCGVTVSKLKANFDDSWPKDLLDTYYFEVYNGKCKLGETTYCHPSVGVGLDGRSRSIPVEVRLYTGNKGGTDFYMIATRDVNLKPLLRPVAVTPTTIELRPNKGDAKITSQTLFFSGNGIKPNNGVYPSVEGSLLTSMPQGVVFVNAVIRGETPNGEQFTAKLGSEPALDKGLKVSMPQISMETKPVKVVNAGSAIVAAQTNVDEREPNFGFQWKKYDAPASLSPSESYCCIYDGVAEGYIKNLQSSHYYDVRAFYRDVAGKCYYGQWVTFDPSDFSFFEPTVHTYATTEVTHRTAAIRGYILRGSDDVIDQGFEYGRADGIESSSSFKRAPVTASSSTVSISGQVIEYTLTDLEPDTEYFYRAYIVTEGGTYYGETQTFRTEDAPLDGIGSIEDVNNHDRELLGVFDLYGRRVSDSYRGFCIEVYSDGTTCKIFRK